MDRHLRLPNQMMKKKHYPAEKKPCINPFDRSLKGRERMEVFDSVFQICYQASNSVKNPALNPALVFSLASRHSSRSIDFGANFYDVILIASTIGWDKFCWQNFEHNKRFFRRAFCRHNKALSSRI